MINELVVFSAGFIIAFVLTAPYIKKRIFLKIVNLIDNRIANYTFSEREHKMKRVLNKEELKSFLERLKGDDF